MVLAAVAAAEDVGAVDAEVVAPKRGTTTLVRSSNQGGRLPSGGDRLNQVFDKIFRILDSHT